MTSSPPAAIAPQAEYRRRARRIRSAFAAAPVSRMRALQALAHEQDRVRREEPAPGPVVTLPEGSARRFAQLVRERMDGPVLRYSHRTRLIRSAEQCGIGRFEANLIIAAVQHQAGAERPIASPRGVCPVWIPAAVAFAGTQALVATAAWWLIG